MSHDADVLNRLISLLRAAAKGYRAAGGDGPGLADVFGAAASAQELTAEILASEVRALGAASAEASGSASMHHAWSDLPQALAGGPRATAEAVERAEAELVHEFRAVVEDPALSAAVRGAVVRAFHDVEAGHAAALQRLEALGGPATSAAEW